MVVISFRFAGSSDDLVAASWRSFFRESKDSAQNRYFGKTRHEIWVS